MVVKAIGSGLQGGDFNTPLSMVQALAIKKAGLDFVLRYIPRTPELAAGNLTANELHNLLLANLAVSCVQHVALAGWEPTAGLGTTYGTYAGEYCKEIGLPSGVNVWLDLEEVLPTATEEQVSAYCTEWYDSVLAASYKPGIYVGWGVVLSDLQLYALPFTSYWKAYNCDQSIPGRGWQLSQHPAKKINGIQYDPNTSSVDMKGDSALFVFNS